MSAAPFWFPTRFTFWHTLQWRASSFVRCRVTGHGRAHERKKKRDSDTGVAREAEVTQSEKVNNRPHKKGLKDCILLWCSRRLWSSVESTRDRKKEVTSGANTTPLWEQSKIAGIHPKDPLVHLRARGRSPHRHPYRVWRRKCRARGGAAACAGKSPRRLSAEVPASILAWRSVRGLSS